MTWRLVQKSTPDSPIAICYLIGPFLDAELRSCLPNFSIVATAEAPLQGGDISAARKLAGVKNSAPLVLIGYSAGCQPVRAHLLNGVNPIAVVTIDGTHSSLPMSNAHIDLWRQVALEAFRNDLTWVATCSMQKYVERLATGRYAAASTVLARVLLNDDLQSRKPLAKPLAIYPGEPVVEHHDGSMHLLAYDGTDCDRDAHLAQCQKVLPDMLVKYIAPLAEQTATVKPKEETRPLTYFGEYVLDFAKEQLNEGLLEETHNDSPQIRDRYLNPLGIAIGSNYCAAFVSFCVRMASDKTGHAQPVGSAGAKVLMSQFQVAKRWHPKSSLKELMKPGDVVVWDRSVAGKPETSWHGHTGVVYMVGDEVFWTIEGNADRVLNVNNKVYAVCMVERRLDDPKLLGAGHW